MKTARQSKIVEMITKHNVNTQEQLLELLKRAGYQATQATISRDIKNLKLVKVPSENGGYKYAVSTLRSSAGGEGNLISPILREVVLSAAAAGNLAVVRCKTGTANAACAIIDQMVFDGVVGTIAGDDTIFVALKTEQRAAGFVKKLEEFIVS